MIQVDQLSKTFHVHRKDPGFWGSVRSLFRRRTVAREAVREVSFQVAAGEIVGLVGANGAGKTTLVKMLAGIIHPTAGDASVLGFRPWERQNAYRRQIALIMGQKAQLWWDLPAADCFLLLREIYQIPPARFRENLAYLTDTLGVHDELNIQIRRLSLGERMKMEIIAALLHSPRVVFLDEPTIGLDLVAQRAIRDFILRYREDHQPAMIVTSHYMADIERLCPRILILRQGRLIFDGPLERIARHYAGGKVVTAHLRKTSRPVEPTPTLEALGEIVTCNDLLIRLHVPREEVTRAAAAVLESYPVVDITIEEEEIEVIIERILQSREVSLP